VAGILQGTRSLSSVLQEQEQAEGCAPHTYLQALYWIHTLFCYYALGKKLSVVRYRPFTTWFKETGCRCGLHSDVHIMVFLVREPCSLVTEYHRFNGT
jgi:hypothetical protein